MREFIFEVQVVSNGRRSSAVAWSESHIDEASARTEAQKISKEFNAGETVKTVAIHENDEEICCYESKIAEGVIKTREKTRKKKTDK